MEDVAKLGFYALLLLPGFIWVQVFEYHLVREKKPQLEKTLEIVLFSALIWILAIVMPFWWPWAGSREICIGSLPGLLGGGHGQASHWTDVLLRCSSRFFLG